MGGKSTTTSSMDPTQQKYIEQYIMPAAGAVKDKEYEAYTGERVAGLSGLEQKALSSFGDVRPRTPADRAAELSSIQDQLAPMLNRKFAQQGVGTEAQAIKAGAFGDRRDVYEGERQAALDAQMYNLSSQELARRDQEAAARQQMAVQQLGAGAVARGVDQLGLDRAYEAYLMEQQFPLTQLSALTGGSASFPAGIGTTTTSDPMGNAGNIMQAGGNLAYGLSFLSDVRLKDNIVHEDTRNGVKFYSWTWNKDAQSKGLKGRSYGVIAQELEEIYPHLVEVGGDGYKRVKYSDLYKELV